MKKPDLAQIYTDKETLRIEKEMRKVYKEAGKDIKAKLSDFNAKHKVKDNMYRQRVKDGLMEKADYDAWKQGQVFQKKEFKAKQEEIARTLTNANSAANKIAQGHVNNVFAYNANYMHYKLEKGVNANLGFGMYDNATVARLLKENPQLLPPKKLNPAKDIAWNMKGIKNQLTQSIIQGESIDDLTERLATEMPNRSYKQARTHARTMMTSAQNAGRLEAMKEHQAMGIDVAKKWLATLDERTRWMHRDLDGQEKELDEYFEVGQYKIRYPADPLAAPAMVYNCRCSMEEVLKKYPDVDKMRRDNTDQSVIKSMTYNEWASWKGIANERPNGMRPVTPNNAKGATTAIGGYTIGDVIDWYVFNANNVETHSIRIEREKDYPFPDGTYNGIKEYRDADVFVLDDGTRFVFPADMDTTKQTATPDLMINQWYEVPEEYRKKIQKEIIIADYRNVQDAYWSVKYNYKDFQSYATGGKEITFYEYNVAHDPVYVTRTFVHEGAHFIDSYSNNQIISESNEWINAMVDDLGVSGKKSPTAYGGVHMHEDFAESAAEYIQHRNMMEMDFPNRSKILERIVYGTSKGKGRVV